MKERFKIEILDKKTKTKMILHVRNYEYNVDYELFNTSERVHEFTGNQIITIRLNNPTVKHTKKKRKK